MDRETKIRIFESAKAEFVRHKWDVFEDEPPSVGAGGSGATVVGCPACRKRINTLDGFFRHQSDDVLPVILQKAFEIAGANKIISSFRVSSVLVLYIASSCPAALRRRFAWPELSRHRRC